MPSSPHATGKSQQTHPGCGQGSYICHWGWASLAQEELVHPEKKDFHSGDADKRKGNALMTPRSTVPLGVLSDV